jgi:hypothetical protein
MIFLSVVVLITVCAHLMLYRFAVRCLEVAHPAARGVLLVVFMLLGVSFIAAFFLLRWDENPSDHRLLQGIGRLVRPVHQTRAGRRGDLADLRPHARGARPQ